MNDERPVYWTFRFKFRGSVAADLTDEEWQRVDSMIHATVEWRTLSAALSDQRAWEQASDPAEHEADPRRTEQLVEAVEEAELVLGAAVRAIVKEVQLERDTIANEYLSMDRVVARSHYESTRSLIDTRKWREKWAEEKADEDAATG